MKTVEMKLPNGFEITAIEQSESIINEIWGNKYYEKKFKIQAGMKVVDIGANQGFFSLYAADKGATVYAYEPEQVNFSILNDNVNRNGLTESIFCNRCAVTKSSGNIKIYLTDYETPFASGMVTTSKDFVLQNVIHDDNESIIEQTVPSVTLDFILSNINDTIDLIKLDCEGAEVDILSTVNKASMEKVKNIVMETHDVYPFSIIFQRVIELGFSVEYFEKPQAPFGTGYLFATKNNSVNDPKFNNNAIAILNAPQCDFKGEIIVIDASQSFTILKKDEVKYNWYINNKFLEEFQTAKIDYVFESFGPQIVEIEIVDSSGNSDRDKKVVWIFDKGYSKNLSTVEIPDRGISQIYSVEGEESFVIPYKMFPLHWMPDRVVIGLFFIDKFPDDCYLHFNGEESKIDKKYLELPFENFPPQKDLIFKLKVANRTNVEIKWWWIKDLKNIIGAVEKDGLIYLGTMSNESYVNLDGVTKFIGKKEYYPSDYKLSCIKVGISAYLMNGKNTQMQGSLEYGDTCYALTGWYTEVAINNFSSDENIEFAIDLPEIRRIKIVWWAE